MDFNEDGAEASERAQNESEADQRVIGQLARAMKALNTSTQEDNGAPNAEVDPLAAFEQHVLQRRSAHSENAIDVVNCWSRPLSVNIIDQLRKTCPSYEGLPVATPAVGRENALTVHMHQKLGCAINYMVSAMDNESHEDMQSSVVILRSLWEDLHQQRRRNVAGPAANALPPRQDVPSNLFSASEAEILRKAKQSSRGSGRGWRFGRGGGRGGRGGRGNGGPERSGSRGRSSSRPRFPFQRRSSSAGSRGGKAPFPKK